MVEVLPQPRVDTLVRPAGGGPDLRRTEYTGTAWIQGRAEVAGAFLRRIGQPGAFMTGVETAFFVPDSLPYTRAALGDAQLSLSVALQAAGENAAITDATAEFADDPSGSPTWVRVSLAAWAAWPCAVSYRVVALAPPEAIA
jgi:hypothetical protein